MTEYLQAAWALRWLFAFFICFTVFVLWLDRRMHRGVSDGPVLVVPAQRKPVD